jgi:hypothetical protein
MALRTSQESRDPIQFSGSSRGESLQDLKKREMYEELPKVKTLQHGLQPKRTSIAQATHHSPRHSSLLLAEKQNLVAKPACGNIIKSFALP